MKYLFVLLSLCLLFFAAWLLMMMPRLKKHPLTGRIHSFYYAHRGLHGGSVPENSLAAFDLAAKRGYGIELDVHLSGDSNLPVIHDSSLLRTAGTQKYISDLTVSEIKSCFLEGTKEKIPLLEEVLEHIDSKVPLLIELKVDNNNVSKICEAVMAKLKKYRGDYAIQSFDPRVIRYFKKNYPCVMRGQLAGYLRRAGDRLNLLLDFGLRNLMSNFLTRPDFISYRFSDIRSPAMFICRKLYRVTEFNWTLRSQNEADTALSNNAVPIFEDFAPNKK